MYENDYGVSDSSAGWVGRVEIGSRKLSCEKMISRVKKKSRENMDEHALTYSFFALCARVIP